MALVIDRLTLEGLRSFKTENTFELRPITLLYGQNSAGKSTVIKSLLLLRQSLDNQNQRRSGDFVFSGDSVDLGSFSSAVFGHHLNSRISIGLQFPEKPTGRSSGARELSDEQMAIRWTFGRDNRNLEVSIEVLGRRLNFSSETPRVARRSQRGDRNLDSYLVLDTASIPDFVELLAPNQDLFLESDRLFNDLQANIGLRPAFQFGFLPIFVRGTFRNNEFNPYGRDDGDLDDFSNAAGDGLQLRWERFARVVNSRLRRKINQLAYIGPLRREPLRFERFSPTSGVHVGQQGEGMLSLLYSNSQYVQSVNMFLKQMEMPYQVKVSQIKSQETLGSLIHMSLVNEVGLELAPTDVGVGYSQVLPLITQSVASRGNLLCIEQPELHLHPAMQSRLADVFIEAARSGHNVQYIIETHSENLILRIMRRIRQGVLSPTDVQVIYVDQDSNGESTSVVLPLDKYGDFQKPWPHGFFDERLHEIDFD